jgi:hypothetical protein
LGDEIAWLREDQGAELAALCGGAVRSDQHAVAARLADGFHDQTVEVLEDVLPIRGVSAQIRVDVGQNRLLGQVEADDRRQIGVYRFVVGNPGADRVHDADVAGAIRIEQAGHAEMRIGSECQRIQEVVVHPAIDDVHAPQAGRRAHVDDRVVDQQVAPFDQRDAHLAGEERVLEIRRVADPRGQHHDRRIRAVLRRQRAQRRQQGLTVVRDRPHVVSVEQPRKHPFGHRAVRQHVRHPAGYAQVVLQRHEAAVLEPDQVSSRHGYVDVPMHAHAAHLTAVVAAAEHQFPWHHALSEDAALVVDVLEKQIDGDEPLGEAPFQRVPFARRDDARQQIEGEDPFGSLFVAVDGKGDALRQERAVGFDLPPPHVVERDRRQFIDERLIVRAGVRRRVEHLVERTIEVVLAKQARDRSRWRAQPVRRCGHRQGRRGHHGSVGPSSSPDRNVGRLRFASPRAVRADDRAPRRPPQEPDVHQRIDDVAAIVDAESDEAHGLRHGQFQPRHLVEVGADPVDSL